MCTSYFLGEYPKIYLEFSHFAWLLSFGLVLVLTEVTMKCRPAPVLKLCQSPLPGHCCNSGIFHGASPRCFPYTTVCQLTQPVVGYTARDTALELGPPSGTRKLIPLLLDAGTSRCTRSFQQADGITLRLIVVQCHVCVVPLE